MLRQRSLVWCVNPQTRSSHGLFRGTIAEKDPRVFGPAPAAGGAAGGYFVISQLGNACFSSAPPAPVTVTRFLARRK